MLIFAAPGVYGYGLLMPLIRFLLFLTFPSNVRLPTRAVASLSGEGGSSLFFDCC